MTDPRGKWLRLGVEKFPLVLMLAGGLAIGYVVHAGLTPAGPSGGGPTATEAAGPAKPRAHWTCSMHPQINLPKPGLCPICSMQLIPLKSDDASSGGLRELRVSDAARRLMEVQTVPVERKFVEAEVRMVGKIDFDETRLKYITAWVPGRLVRLFVDYTGVPVKKGDHLVELYSPELLSAQEELLQALRAVKELADSDVSIVRETAEATVTASREKLRLWGLTAEQIAAIEKRGKPTDHITIHAPVGGIVIHKNAREGMYVKTGSRIYTIADLSQVWVRLDAYESDLVWLRYGQKIEFAAEAYPGETFAGTIAFIDPVVTQATRTVKVRVNATNARRKLKPGMFVRAIARSKFDAGGRVMDTALAGKWICPMHPEVVKESAGKCDLCQMPLVRTESLGYVGIDPARAPRPLVIPVSAALVTGGRRAGTRAIVYVEVPDRDKPTFEGREIVLGPRAGDYYLVRRGLVEGERVVTRGNFKIDAELQIRAKPSMMTPEAGGGAGVKLPAAVRAQLREVLAAGDRARKAVRTGKLAAVRAAYADLQEKVAAVPPDALLGHAGMLWKECAMLLTNDGVEGKDVKTLPDAKRLAAVTAEHLASMKSKLGLADPAAAGGGGGPSR